MNKLIIALVTAALLALAAAGCTGGNGLKQEVIQAFDKQKDMNSYRFSGQTVLQTDYKLANPDRQPLTAGLFELLKQSTLSWEGVASRNPARLEMTWKITPQGRNSSIEVPFIVKDDKAYFHIPSINAENEYFVMDLQKSPQGSQLALTPEMLNQAAGLPSFILKSLTESINPNWFSEKKDTQADAPAAGKSVSIEIKPENFGDFVKDVISVLPDISAELQKIGLPAAQLQKLPERLSSSADSMRLRQPLTLTVALDKQGFVRGETINLDLAIKQSDGTETHVQLQKQTKYDQINGNPAFSMEIPQNTKSIEDVLRLVK
ncbi:hypothetical protein [Ferviditalea candida]|uniref:Lipoprotein n=1 Tax=Ferviditalea candida TaxID=3108399 RepID=A0ABU5ZDR7_9BACL|nr:hypothetical protein [Paenibacillaceae bacterium T2]